MGTETNITNPIAEPEKEEYAKNVTETPKKAEKDDEYTSREKGFIVGLAI